ALPPPLSSPLFPYTTLFRSDVGVETVDLEAGFLQHQRHEVLHGPLLAGDRGYPNEVLRQPDTGTRVEGVQRFCDGRFSDHAAVRSEEHTSELQSRGHLVCRL